MYFHYTASAWHVLLWKTNKNLGIKFPAHDGGWFPIWIQSRSFGRGPVVWNLPGGLTRELQVASQSLFRSTGALMGFIEKNLNIGLPKLPWMWQRHWSPWCNIDPGWLAPLGQNGRHLADNIFVNVKFSISNWISRNFVPKGLIDNKSMLVQVMAWRRTGDKPLPEPMLT